VLLGPELEYQRRGLFPLYPDLCSALVALLPKNRLLSEGLEKLALTGSKNILPRLLFGFGTASVSLLRRARPKIAATTVAVSIIAPSILATSANILRSSSTLPTVGGRPGNPAGGSVLVLFEGSEEGASVMVTVGDPVSDWLVTLGCIVGTCVGCLVGCLVGLVDGFRLGELVGAKVSALVGTAIGLALGLLVGALVGVSVGPTLGDAVGLLVGLSVGLPVGLSVISSSTPPTHWNFLSRRKTVPVLRKS